ncbi:hypothetical protein RJ641_008117 [Dillenia turbinata]|uniref:Uncharacterized protein n=1 Tax=Dillenia turbinata TaxID=194707 RepID=A0AAN8VF03_9MAGN
MVKDVCQSKMTPNILALIALQRHIAASMSTRGSSTEQQGVDRGAGAVPFFNSFSSVLHTANLSTSVAQVTGPGCGGGLTGGTGTGFGFGG